MVGIEPGFRELLYWDWETKGYSELVQSQIHFAKCLKLREVCYQILLNCYIKKAMQLNVELFLPNPALTQGEKNIWKELGLNLRPL